jgi:ribosomal protein S21
MTSIRVKENEPFDVALRRFKRAVEMAARDHPGYLEQTYQRARYYVSYYMK